MAAMDVSKYAHSPVHKAVITRDYAALKRILDTLPSLAKPSEIRTEAASIAEEDKADAISAIIDRRDVPNRETPLHLAVKLADTTAAEMLMAAGADWSLQNEQGWSALQEAICTREETLAKIIVRHYQPLAWAKWCRRLPRVVAAMKRMRDFYMELTFHFESSVIPFISRIAPSDTYKIWKRGSNLRADMTLAGFDGLRIQRSDQSILFLGDGSEDGKVLPGSLCMISHKDKEVMNALDGAGAQASEAEIQQEVTAMSQANIFRPGIDVTQAVLFPQLTWRRQEKTEMVGSWKAKVYDMHHVVVSVKSRRVPGAPMDDDEFFAPGNENDTESEDYEDILTAEERRQLENALKMESSDMVEDGVADDYVAHRRSCYERREIPIEGVSSCTSSSGGGDVRSDKKGWFGNWGKRGQSQKPEEQKKMMPPRNSLCIDEKVSDLLGDSPAKIQKGRHSIEIPIKSEDFRKGRDKESKKSASSSENAHRRKDSGKESEYKKGLRPVLWLSPDFPLRTDELLPLLDILANKVKAIRRLRELLTTKLPAGTFPVKVAIPVVPTIRVIVTFTKFEELPPAEEFSTPPSSPISKSPMVQSSSSWFQWIKAPYRANYPSTLGPSSRVEDIQDPFMIPSGYTWITPEAKKKQMQESKGKSKKGRTQPQ
ncbi:LOW QUALITY PROTEIN: ankyrin repeat domain-containing protein 13C-like [Dioscorea cayenensis subsp. rotundata]|uniref:LOW QUALITY PROTEIN: ankyrin repeat domain-containing protein 13C-like n=1 Tax=Dioscorea cayennensis subsp. rotundata TaxID=55577 RepID=A0AB40CGE8_DIOCR|nr:LOW QUALITY PROTEIN: ankyrin repeat domain-containing protein 13C-like [Dioscorea cayenensis subsp. rotundata]